MDDKVEIVFNHWKSIMGQPDAKCDSSRIKIIQQALSMGYSFSQLCEAITGCYHAPYNRGHNEKGQRFDGLHIILRDADQIDRFRRNSLNPPQLPTLSNSRTRSSIQATTNWLAQKMDADRNHHDDW